MFHDLRENLALLVRQKIQTHHFCVRCDVRQGCQSHLCYYFGRGQECKRSQSGIKTERSESQVLRPHFSFPIMRFIPFSDFSECDGENMALSLGPKYNKWPYRMA